MNNHLTPEQLVDAIERPMSAECESHVGACAVCAGELAEMRMLMSDVAVAGTVPEPSPLFWDHLSARVREAVNDVPVSRPWWQMSWRPLAVAVGVIGAMIIAVVLRSPTAVVPIVVSTPVDSSVADATAIAEPTSDSEAMWDMISTLAPSMPADQAYDAGLRPTRTATDAAFESLTQAQRQELMKLLKKEIAPSE